MFKKGWKNNILTGLALLTLWGIILSQVALAYGHNPTSIILAQENSPDLSSNDFRMLTVETLPPTSNIPIVLNGSMLYTGSDGTISSLLPQSTYVLEAISETYISENTKATFTKWGDLFDPQSFEIERTIVLTNDKVVRLLLAIHHRVSLAFSDSSGTRIDTSLVESVLVGASDGQSYMLRTYENLWFPGNRFQRVQAPITWKVVNISYTFNEVTVLGRNTVQRGLHVFAPGPDATWGVSLNLYSLKVEVTDFFFGFPIDTEIKISDLSNGDMVLTSRSSLGVLTSENFPRGSYMISVRGIGVALPVSVVFTKPMTVEVRLFSIFDIVFVLALAAAFAGALLLRRHYSARRHQRKWTNSTSFLLDNIDCGVWGWPAKSNRIYIIDPWGR